MLPLLANSNEHLLKRTHSVSSIHSTSTAVAAMGVGGLQWTQRLCPWGQHGPSCRKQLGHKLQKLLRERKIKEGSQKG